MRLQGGGLSVELPGGWEGEVLGGGELTTQAEGLAERRVVAHFANFPLPAERADFGAGAVELMRPGDAFVVLFEYGPEAVGQPLFASEGIPRITARDFDRNALQHGIPGQSGLQRFFTVNGRAFCLYVVVGSHIDRADVIPQINQVLESVVVG
ncbi:MAG: hypothetical protein FWJ92_13780 [Actinomycetes bacterium]|jgi:hypothetical protein|nr:hypothetical protein [Acidimicrobiia bacterium]